MDKTTALAPLSGQKTETKELKPLHIPAPVFIVFAEYMGYVSFLLDEATKVCCGATSPLYLEYLMKIDASLLYNAMLKEYSKNDIRDWYETYYPVLEALYDNIIPDPEQV